MTGLLKQEHKPTERVEVFDPFERMFDDWTKMFPFRRSMLAPPTWAASEMIRVDEFRENGSLVVRAELPGIDPEKDVELTVSNGMLCIDAERRDEEDLEEKGYVRHELRVGSFSRVLPIPEGVSEADITATYKDGILEVRLPAPENKPAAKIPIAKG